MKSTLLQVRETVTRHRSQTARQELREHDARLSEEFAEQRAEHPCRPKPYTLNGSCGCDFEVARNPAADRWPSRCAEWKRVRLADEA